MVVTSFLGGTPTEAGLSHSFVWGGILGGIGAGLGYGMGQSLATKALPAEAADATEAAYKASDFRKNLAKSTGKNPKGYDAHHMLPQEFEKRFEEIGFKGANSIHNPKYGAWWESMSHRSQSNVYNAYWREFLAFDVTEEDVFAFAQVLGGIFGI